MDGRRTSWDAALDRIADTLPRHHGRTRPGQRGAVRVRPVADRGLLRGQQVHQGLPRHRQHRQQLAPVHVVRRRRAPPRLRGGHRPRHLRGPGTRRPAGAGRQQHRLVPPGAVPAHRRRPGGPAGHARGGDRPAPHRHLRGGGHAPGDRAGHGRGAVRRAAALPAPQRTHGPRLRRLPGRHRGRRGRRRHRRQRGRDLRPARDRDHHVLRAVRAHAQDGHAVQPGGEPVLLRRRTR